MFIFPVPRSKRLYVEWRDHRNHAHRWAGYVEDHKHPKLTEVLGDKLERLAGYASHRIEPPADLVAWVRELPQRRREKLAALGMLAGCSVPVGSVAEHLKAWGRHLESLERTHEHRRHAAARVQRAVEELGIVSLDTLKAEPVMEWVGRLRQAGMSSTTANHYIVAMKTFTRWAWTSGRLATDPLRNVRRLPAGETVRNRRALDDGEVRKLLARVEGTDRYWVYRLAIETGLRRGELAQLRRRDFDLRRRVLTVQAAYAKARRIRIVPLRSETCRAFGPSIQTLAPDALALSIPKRPGEVLRADLKAARVSTTDVDFHALRHTAATRLGYSVESFPDLMVLLGHSTPAMSARYFHSDLERMRRAVEATEPVSVPVSVNMGKKRPNRSKPSQKKKASNSRANDVVPITYRKSG